ncbi:hypothetical protein M413DRAFT_442044 [Hebeloma cylindrosporum]|uniref:Ribosomal lysine N-methyltransferase 4 n=1 Tax=Hebeloma cylindrosporum TaxID=76867 RepID=A0A0C3C955_HEBCY|nr:hypothetical protein M413DRAFT_442044 [Hebeloma cylindrosporum h7]
MEIQPFFSWFQSHNGYVDTSTMDVIQFPPSEGGRGAIALKDIPEGHVLFSVPRTLLLSTQTSLLPSHFGIDAWKNFGLHKGWSGLILCMMWEAAQGSESKWKPYFDILPTKLDTPMFWSDADLAELAGTSVVEKLGKEEAENDYREKIVPAVSTRPDLFPKEDLTTRYSINTFHLMGNLILSRSFTLDDQDEDEDEEEEEKEHATGDEHQDIGNTSLGSAMDVDAPISATNEHSEEEANEDGDDDEETSTLEVAMVPLADILNARYQCENVKLFYEPDCLKMISTRPIKTGEQIWNTYGDPPNSVLLRQYGHVDYIPLLEGGLGNPGDVVELRADLLVQSTGAEGSIEDNPDMKERIEFWLEEGGDDVFVLEAPSTSTSIELPPALLSFTQLIQSEAEWERAKSKGKLPKPKANIDTLKIIQEALARRSKAYPTTLEEDTQLESTSLNSLSLNRRHALVVRIGEKKILERYREKVSEMIKIMEAPQVKKPARGGGKRKADRDSGEIRKKRKEMR